MLRNLQSKQQRPTPLLLRPQQLLRRRDLEELYRRLFKRFGPQYWWPGRTKFEVMVGAILTQNTNWGNVEKAIHNLRRAGVLNLTAIHRISEKNLAHLIKPSGYFNVKAKRLKNLVHFIMRTYHGNLIRMQKEPLSKLRQELLSINGIGPETADSILLYALNKPSFVVDAYTKRFLQRHNLIKDNADYHEMQKLFMHHLPHDRNYFNEYHALIVRLGKDFCKTKASCEACPLNDFYYTV